MSLDLVTPPAEEPLTLSEAKEHLRVTGAGDDAYITALIAIARENAEQELGRQLVTATWDLFLDRFPDGSARVLDELERYVIRVPLPPLQSVTHIKYYDSAGALTTLDPSDYLVDAASKPARIAPAYLATWPRTREQLGAVNVRFVAGYGDAGDVPDAIKQWMRLRIGAMYEHREEEVAVPSIVRLGFADRLLDPYRLTVLA